MDLPDEITSRKCKSKVDSSSTEADEAVKDVEFSSMHNVFIDTLPARLARFVVRAFTGSSYEFKLDMGIIRVTLEKVHKILGVPLGGTSIFNLPVIHLDDPFIKMWFKQFQPKPLKDIHASNIAGKLVLAKTVDFMFKLNFLMLFTNVIDTNVAGIDWCGFIYKCLQDSAEPKTVNGFYIGSLCFLILLYFDLTKFYQFPVIH
ncbi:hypothetical protein Tco_0290713 [Tanacetum coccineum]